MKFIIEGKDYIIHFNHNQDVDIHNVKGITLAEGITLATLYEYNKASKSKVSTSVRGHAFCSKKQNFNKSFARKLALKRLIKDYEFTIKPLSKEIRRSIWEQYFNQCNDRFKPVHKNVKNKYD